MAAALVFDKYEVVKRIAAGGMGEVFLARQQQPDRPAILKGLRPMPGPAGELNAQRFLAEARLAAKLDHPNVVSVFESGAWGGRFFIAMEYIPGWNLAQLLRTAHERQLRVDPWVCAWLVRDAARGLHHAHALGIVHRDVSPQNLVVRTDGRTKVVDFGVAWALNPDPAPQPDGIVGRVAYLAPEQLTGAAPDARSDQYALGVVLWELLAARRMHDGKLTEAEVAKAVRAAQVPPLAPAVPAALSDVAMRMLRASPGERFAGCDGVAAALDALLAAQPETEAAVHALLSRLGPVSAESETSAVRERSRGPAPRASRGRMWLVLAALTLTGASLLWARTRVSPARSASALKR